MSAEQPNSSPPPGAAPIWGSSDGSGPPVATDPASSSGRPSGIEALAGGEEPDPLSRRLFGAAVFLSILLLGVLANSFLNGGGEDRLELNPVAAAAERTQDQPGARFSLEAVYTSPSLPQPMYAEGSGSINTETGRSRAVVALEGPEGVQVRIETLSDGTTLYLRGTGISDGLPDGKEWMAMQPFLGHSEQEAMVGGSDAEGALQMLTTVDGSVRELGREEVRGVPTRRYRTSVSLSDYAGLLRDEGKDELADHYEKLASLMPEPVIGEAWIDAQGMLRRNRIVMELPSESGQPALTMDMSMDLFDFGARPEIELPDNDAVFDATPLLEAQLDAAEAS